MWRDRTKILDPDSRFAYMVRGVDPRTGPNFVTIEDMHGDMDGLNFGSAVPDDIRRQFDIARNSYLYSWFDYEMVTLAEMHAFTAVEMAIRRRASD